MKSKTRCSWVNLKNEVYVSYHDEEWGLPVFDDTKLFEFLILEGAQAGLSWETVLKRRVEYKKAFANWDVNKVAHFDEHNVQELLANPGIIRNKLKVKSAIQNAQACIKIQEEFGSFSTYLWQFVNNKPVKNHYKDVQQISVQSEISQKISADLKKRGCTFVGPTIMYAFMQAVGLVCDHTTDCFRYNEI